MSVSSESSEGMEEGGKGNCVCGETHSGGEVGV